MHVSVCEYLVIWCDKTTVHEIIDSSSIKTCFKLALCEDVDWIHLDEDMIHRLAVAIVVINLINL
jgi:hypothetical protein